MEIGKKYGIFEKLYFCFFILLPFVYFDKLVDPVLIPRQVFLTLFLFILSSLIIYNVYKKKLFADFSFLKLRLFSCLAVFIILALISFSQSLALSESIYVFSKLLVEILFFVITTYLLIQNQLSTPALLKSVTVFGCIVLVQVFFQAVRLSMSSSDFFDNMLNISATFGHKNLLASILFLTIPFILASMELSKGWKITGYLSLPLIPLIAWLLQSKAIIAASVIFILLICLFLVAGDQERPKKGFTKTTILLVTLLLVLIGSFTVLNKEKFPRIFDKKSARERLGLWENSKHMIQENPLLGVGAGNWQVHFPKYGMDKFQIPEVRNGITTFQRPHNDFLWVFCEMGAIGVMSYILLFVVIFYYLLQLFKKTQEQKFRLLYPSLFVVLVCYVFIACIDFPLERIEHQVMLFLLFSIITSRYHTLWKKNGSKSSQQPFFLLIFLLTPILISFLVSYKRWKGELHTQRLYLFERTANWERMFKEGKKAQSMYYTMDPMSAPIEWYNGVALFSIGDRLGAKQCFEKAYALHPYNMHVINNLASCYESEGSHKKAEEYYLRALAISSGFEEARLNLSAVYFNTKEYTKAFETIDKCDVNSSDPKYASFLPVILNGWIEELLANQKDPAVIQQLKDMNSNNGNLLSVYKALKEKGIDFKTYILTNKY